MSSYGFSTDADGNILIDNDLIEYLIDMNKQLKLLNARLEEAFDTKITIEDIE